MALLALLEVLLPVLLVLQQLFRYQASAAWAGLVAPELLRLTLPVVLLPRLPIHGYLSDAQQLLRLDHFQVRVARYIGNLSFLLVAAVVRLLIPLPVAPAATGAMAPVVAVVALARPAAEGVTAAQGS